jgi:hypothetical protein
VNQYDVPKLLKSAYLRVATPLNTISGFKSSGIWPYNPMFSLMLIMLQSLIAHTLILLQLLLLIFQILKSLPYADEFSLSKTETPLSNDSLIQCEQLKPGPFTRYSPLDVRPCPTAEQSVHSGRNRKCRRREILIIIPVKKPQRENFGKKERKRECVSLPESKKEVSLKFVLPGKQRVFPRRDTFARCVNIPAMNRPKKPGHSAPSVQCGDTSRVLVTVAVGLAFVTNVLIKCFELICIHFAQFRNSLYRGTHGKDRLVECCEV